MITREVARRNLIRSMTLCYEERIPEAQRPSPVQYALQGTWAHPTPSMIGIPGTGAYLPHEI